MRIKVIAIAELDDFIRSEEYLSFDPLPITPERALSQTQNPHAHPQDPALWVAIDDNGELMGFIGSLPAFDNRSQRRMGWNSCWWVHPEKGREAAMPLFYTFLKQWDQNVAFSDMTTNTFEIINQMDFCHTREEKIFIGYFRIGFKEAFKSQNRLPYPLAPFFALVTPIVDLFQSIRISTTGRNLKGIQMEVKMHADEEMVNFIQEHQDNEFSQRDSKDFNWILNQKWLVKSSEAALDTAYRYPFSYVSDDFEWKWITTRMEGEINSVMLISIRDHALKVIYYYGDSPGFALLALKSYISENSNIRKVIFSHPQLLENSRMLNSILLFKRSKKRFIGISKTLSDKFSPDLIMQLGDGDAAFT